MWGGVQKRTLQSTSFLLQNPTISTTKSHLKNSNHFSDKEITMTVEYFRYGAFNSALDFLKVRNSTKRNKYE